MHATSGSATVDLIAPRECILTPAGGVHKLATGVYGPIPAATVGLLLGRSSLTLQGITVHTGVIDEDYNGEISIMISVTKSIEFNKGQRIAQLLLLPYIKQAAAPVKRTGGFGSTGKNVFWQSFINDQRPQLTITFNNNVKFTGLFDTGADVSIIKQSEWPSYWPLEKVEASLIGALLALPEEKGV